LTRYEFAAVAECLFRPERTDGSNIGVGNQRRPGYLQRLQEEFATELATLRGRVDALEATTAELKRTSFHHH